MCIGVIFTCLYSVVLGKMIIYLEELWQKSSDKFIISGYKDLQLACSNFNFSLSQSYIIAKYPYNLYSNSSLDETLLSSWRHLLGGAKQGYDHRYLLVSYPWCVKYHEPQ